MSVVQVNNRMKAIVTNIISSSGLIVKAITYFEPETDGTNTWYPTIVTKMSSDIFPIKEMQEKKNFSGTLEIVTSAGIYLSRTNVKNNIIVNLDSSPNLALKNKTELNSYNGKVMYVPSGVTDCIRAATSCWNEEVSNMGLIAYASYCATFPLSATLILADCMLHSKACLGINKPAEVINEVNN
jgi:hypothetical protein